MKVDRGIDELHPLRRNVAEAKAAVAKWLEWLSEPQVS